MKTDVKSKLSASLIVLVMAISALAILPGSFAGADAGTNTIFVPVVSGGTPVTTGVTVTLTDVHTGEVITAPYSSTYGVYMATAAPSGYYRVDVVADGYYDEFAADEFRFDGLSTYTVDSVILTEFAPMIYTWNVTVRDVTTNQKIVGADVMFYDPVMDEAVASGKTDSTGVASIAICSSPVLGDLDLVVKADTYRYHLEPVEITGDNLTGDPILLTKSVRVTGFVADYDSPASNVVAYLLNHDAGLTWIERLQKSAMGGSFFAFDTVAGDYTLCVDADGVSSYMENITVSSTSLYYSLEVGDELVNQTQRTEAVSIVYGSDFNSFDLSAATVWSYDDAYPGLEFADMGSLRMQVDLALGDADGAVSVSEALAFRAKVLGFGAQYVTSSRLLTVNDTIYESSLTLSPFSLTLSGALDSTVGVAYSYTCHYTAVDAVDVGADDYTSMAYINYDTAAVSYDYSVALPDSYELVSNATTAHVNVTEYLVVHITADEYTGGPEAISMTFEASETPIAGAGIVDTEYTYAVLEDQNITKYYVRAGFEFNFTAADSSDPNGNPMTYTWLFDDGNTTTTGDVLAAYNFTDAYELYVVNLTVEDVGGLVNWTELNVTVDGMDPTGTITVYNLTVEDEAFRVDEGESIKVNATSSFDDAVTAGDELGLIDYVTFDYGDGNSSGQVDWQDDEQNVTFSYEGAGVYTLYLNVTDVVGHVSTTTMTVTVNDTTAPTATFKVLNETWGTSLQENSTLYFNASATVDNIDELEDMMFSWYFDDDLGDDSWLNGTGMDNVTHTFAATGTFTVKLNVTDLANNSGTYTKNVIVASSARPDVRIDAITFDPEELQEGKAGTIVVNLTNRGSAAATGVTITFYIENDDGTETLIGSTTTMWNGTSQVTSIGIGGTAQVKFSWTPDAKGSFTIKVNVTSTDQLTTHDLNGDVEVKEAAWKQIALWGGVAAVIVLVPLLLYLRGRWSKREKKGPRREKREEKDEE